MAGNRSELVKRLRVVRTLLAIPATVVLTVAVLGGCSEERADGTVSASAIGTVTPEGGKTTTWPTGGELILTPVGEGEEMRADIPASTGEVSLDVAVGDYEAAFLSGAGSDQFQCGPAEAISVQESETLQIDFVCPGI